MNSAESFSADYSQARSKFREAATTSGGVLDVFEYPQKGPDGADLFTDVAYFGAPDAQKVLVLISGTHGVEGFCGSGAQVDLLRRGELTKLPSQVGVLMIHAINPYGFAWMRRVTHENVDLNRNWVDFSRPLPRNACYDELAAAIVPNEWTEASRAAAEAVIDAFTAREGLAARLQALTGGQYQHSKGIFYGGTAPSWSRLTQTKIFEQYLSQAGAVGIIDYHTGIGPWGYGEKISTAAPDSAAFQRALQWYGFAVTSVIGGSTVVSKVGGDGLSAAHLLLPHCEVTAIALEVGTVELGKTHFALRADAWLHAYGDCTSIQGKEIKRLLRDAYYGDAADWKGMVAGQSLLAFRQALAGLRRPRA